MSCVFCNNEKCAGNCVANVESNEQLTIENVPTKRFEIEIVHTIIVYDITEADARRRAPLLYQAVLTQPATHPIAVLSCREIAQPIDEPMPEIVDISPILQRNHK